MSGQADTLRTADVLEVVDREIARLGWTRADLYEALAQRFGYTPDAHYKRLRRAEQAGVMDVAEADRLLVIVDGRLEDVPGYRTPRLRGSIATGDRGYLTDAQVLACHRLYMAGGLSLREVAERILPRTRYVSVLSCAEALRRRFVRLGLDRKGSADHLITHGRAIGHGHGRNRSDYVTAWKRAHGLRPAVRCTAVRDNGEPCRAWAVHGTERCNKHRAEVEAGVVPA